MKRYLIQFLDEWLDFRYAEFTSLLTLFGLETRDVFLTFDSPLFRKFMIQYGQPITECNTDTIESPSTRHMSLIQSCCERNEHFVEDFIAFLRKHAETEHFVILAFSNDQMIRQLCQRCILIKGVYESWAFGEELQETVKGVEAFRSTELCKVYMDASQALTWSVQVLTFGKSTSPTTSYAIFMLIILFENILF